MYILVFTIQRTGNYRINSTVGLGYAFKSRRRDSNAVAALYSFSEQTLHQRRRTTGKRKRTTAAG